MGDADRKCNEDKEVMDIGEKSKKEHGCDGTTCGC